MSEKDKCFSIQIFSVFILLMMNHQLDKYVPLTERSFIAHQPQDSLRNCPTHT